MKNKDYEILLDIEWKLFYKKLEKISETGSTIVLSSKVSF
jgi:hypothetical protein